MFRAPLLLAAACALACGAAREAARGAEPAAPVDPPLEVDRVFAGAIPVTASAEAGPAFREADLRVVTAEPFRLLALRLDGVCRGVAEAPDRPGPRAFAPGDVVRIGEAPGCDYRIGPATACPAPFDAPPWQALLFYETAGTLRVIPFQFVHVGASR